MTAATVVTLWFVYTHALPQISPLSTSPQLSDNDRFPTFLRLVPSDQAVVTGVLSLMARYDWTRIAIIQQQEFIFTSVSGIKFKLGAGVVQC